MIWHFLLAGRFRSAYRVWKFDRALRRLRAAMPLSWRDLSEEEQEAEIADLISYVRKERRRHD